MASYTGKTITTRTKFTSDTYDKCTFTVTSSGYGGALYNSDSGTASLTITGSEFKNCTAYAGSAIYFSGTGTKTVSIADTTFTNCTDSATTWAGTVTNDSVTAADVTVNITRCSFSGGSNYAMSIKGTLNVTDSRFLTANDKIRFYNTLVFSGTNYLNAGIEAVGSPVARLANNAALVFGNTADISVADLTFGTGNSITFGGTGTVTFASGESLSGVAVAVNTSKLDPDNIVYTVATNVSGVYSNAVALSGSSATWAAAVEGTALKVYSCDTTTAAYGPSSNFGGASVGDKVAVTVYGKKFYSTYMGDSAGSGGRLNYGVTVGSEIYTNGTTYMYDCTVDGSGVLRANTGGVYEIVNTTFSSTDSNAVLVLNKSGKLSTVKDSTFSTSNDWIYVDGSGSILEFQGTNTLNANLTVANSGAARLAEGATLNFGGSGRYMNAITVNSGATLNVGGTATANGVVVNSGGTVTVGATAYLTDAVIKAGGTLTLTSGAQVRNGLTFDFTGKATGAAVTVNNLSLVATTVYVKGLDSAATGTYTLGSGATGSEAITLVLDSGSFVLDGTLTGVVNAFTGKTYAKSVSSGELTITASSGSHAIAAVGTAGTLAEYGATVNGSDREAKWTSSTAAASGTVNLASGMTSGNAWLEISGYKGGSTNLFGATTGTDFASGTVNIKATSGTLKNLAGGAGNGGTVAAVDLSFGSGMSITGRTFAGGQGNVTGAVKTQIDGGEFGGVFVGGTYSNKKSTSVGSVNLTIDGGTFHDNVYGGSQVMYASGKTNTVGSVTVNMDYVDEVKGGFSLYAGGMAAGSTHASTAYTVTDGVTVNVTGGNWCDNSAIGGRGLFGGIFAGDSTSGGTTGVTAAVKNGVNINIGGGVLGNVYGGGWAQKGGVSNVTGGVNISVSDGTVKNIFGGGAHSTTGDTGGSTSVDTVNITVSGGEVTGNIYARGQVSGDTVTGISTVKFTGSSNYACNVYGYDYVPVSGSAATSTGTSNLSFSGYAGTISGDIGGFDKIAFTGDARTALTGTVENGSWEFNLRTRDEANKDYAMLDWSGALASGDTVKVTFKNAAQAQGGWSIANVGSVSAGTTFDVGFSGSSIATGLAFGATIADGGYAGYGFTLDGGTLKFAKLA